MRDCQRERERERALVGIRSVLQVGRDYRAQCSSAVPVLLPLLPRPAMDN